MPTAIANIAPIKIIIEEKIITPFEALFLRSLITPPLSFYGGVGGIFPTTY